MKTPAFIQGLVDTLSPGPFAVARPLTFARLCAYDRGCLVGQFLRTIFC